MQDPTRIDSTLAAVRAAWEGQPELSLPTLFAMLSTRGIGWGTSDEDLVAALAELSALHPPSLPLADGKVSHPFLILTEEPAQRVTVDPTRVFVRRPGTDLQPVMWRYNSIRPTGPGRTLVIADDEGIEHRLGVVTTMTRLDPAALEVGELDGVCRREIGERVIMARTRPEGATEKDGESTVLIDHGVHVYTTRRREIIRADYRWEKIVSCGIGKALILSIPGARTVDLGQVLELYGIEGEESGLSLS